MDIQAAISLIEQSSNDKQFSKLKKVFRDRIAELQETDFTERGVDYYYLLRIILNSHLMYETEECRDYLDQMNTAFSKQLHKYFKDRDKFNFNKIHDFFKLMERSYGSLEIIFRKKDFFEEEKHAYQKKMWFRQQKFWFQRRWLEWVEYTTLQWTSNYGNSFLRWGVTAFCFAMAMAGIYFLSDLIQVDPTMKIVGEQTLGKHWYDYIYFSMVVLTSMGLGDILPHSAAAKMLVSLEGFFGFIMLGIFINLIQKKL